MRLKTSGEGHLSDKVWPGGGLGGGLVRRELREGPWASSSREDPGAAPSPSSAQSRSSSPCSCRRERDDIFLGSGSRLYPLLGISRQTHRDSFCGRRANRNSKKETEKAKKHQKKQKRQAIPIVIDLGTGAATPSPPLRPNQAHPKTDGPDRKTPHRENRPQRHAGTRTGRLTHRDTFPLTRASAGCHADAAGTGAALAPSWLAVPPLPRPRAHPLGRLWTTPLSLAPQLREPPVARAGLGQPASAQGTTEQRTAGGFGRAGLGSRRTRGRRGKAGAQPRHRGLRVDPGCWEGLPRTLRKEGEWVVCIGEREEAGVSGWGCGKWIG